MTTRVEVHTCKERRVLVSKVKKNGEMIESTLLEKDNSHLKPYVRGNNPTSFTIWGNDQILKIEEVED